MQLCSQSISLVSSLLLFDCCVLFFGGFFPREMRQSAWENWIFFSFSVFTLIVEKPKDFPAAFEMRWHLFWMPSFQAACFRNSLMACSAAALIFFLVFINSCCAIAFVYYNGGTWPNNSLKKQHRQNPRAADFVFFCFFLMMCGNRSSCYAANNLPEAFVVVTLFHFWRFLPHTMDPFFSLALHWWRSLPKRTKIPLSQ